MQISGMPNKFEIFQDFYYLMNGVQISYSEALRLFAQMDADTIADFEKYYQDETGYEIIVSGGFNLDPDLGAPKENGTKTVKRKQVQADGSIKWVDTTVKAWTMSKTLADGTVVDNFKPQTTQDSINTKYTLDAYAKKNGLVLDPQWAGYSAEEILQMVDEGVNVPQEVVDIANTIMQSTASADQTVEGEEGQEDTTLSFLELIPVAEKKIEKCDKNNEKIEKEIQDLLPEQEKRKRNINDKMKEQRRSLKEYEAFVREWNHIQTKINNGEALSTSEARRYADLMGMFEDKKSGDDKGFSLDKREIAKSMNDINILAILGEKLADETIEIGDTLADYTSQANYKTTRNQAQGEIGFLRAIVAMAQGKALAKEANITGNDTKDFTDETQHSVNDIASVLDIGDMIAGKDEVLGTEQPKEASVEGEGAVQDAEQQPAQDGQAIQETENQGESKETSAEVTEQEDFVINDKNVKELIKEAADINVDLAKQTISAVKSIKVAKDDRKFAQIAGVKVTKLVKEFKKQEEERQARIQAMEQENKEANQELENLTGKSADELNEEQPAEKPEKEEGEQETDKTDKEKVTELRQKIASNNEEIENIKAESEASKGEFANATAKESEIISEAIPAEAEALKKDTEYKEEIIPAAKERLDFTDASGETLSKIGVYRIELGMMQIMAWQFEKGLKNIALGTISTGIGLAAQVVGDTPLDTIAEKATDKATKEEDSAINDLTVLEGEIISVTGAEATQVPVEEDTENEEGVEGAENNEETTPVEGTEQDEEAETVEEAITETEDTAENLGVETPEAPKTPEPTEETPSPEKNVENEEAEQATENAKTENSESSKKENTEEDPASIDKNAKQQESQLKKQTDKQEDIVKDGNKDAKDAGKESKKIEKDEKKSAKQLEKETKKLEKQIKKEQEEVIKLTKESQKAVQKQQEILVEYEALNAENEQMAAQEEAKKLNAPKKVPQQKQNGEEGNGLASNSFTIVSTPDGTDNQSKMDQNNQRINELGIAFKGQDTIVVRNRTKIVKIQDSIETKSKKFEKKIKLKTKKLKDTEKKEKEKQKKLNKIFGIIGIAENIFSITSTTGTVLTQVGTSMETSGTAMIQAGMALLPWPTTPAGISLISAGIPILTTGLSLQTVGGVLTLVGTLGTVACGLTKGIINIANGNLAAGLMAIGSAAVTAATSFAGGGAAAGSALNYVSEGLSIVSSSAELVNNVRAVQGKEASGIASKIGTIAGVGSAVTGAASSVSNMGSQNTLGKIATITSVAGTALSSTSQIMSEFNLGDEKTANLLGTIGGGLQTLGSIGQLANKNNKNENNDENNKSDEKANKEIDKNKNLTPDQKAAAKAKLAELKNNPEQRLAQINAALNDSNIPAEQKNELKALKEKLQKTGLIKEAQQPAQSTKTPASNPAETGNTATVQGDKLVGPDGKQVTIPEGCKIEGGKVIDANGAEVTVNANGAVTQTTYSEGSSVKGGKVYNKNGKEVKLPEGYKVAGNKVIGPNGNEVRLDANGNILKADHQLQLKDARTARERQQNLAEGTDDQDRKENILNGSSEYYSDMNDEQLSSQLANLQGDPNDIMGNINGKNSIGASKLQSELDGRQQYRNQMDLLAAEKQSNSDKLNQILDITGQVANTAMSVAGMFMTQNQEGETKKKHAAPGKLTKRTKEIMRKNAQYRQRRVQALARAQRYYA